MTDRMNRRKINDVESHRLGIVDSRQGTRETLNPGRRPSADRGKNSYHAAVRASTRSTITRGARRILRRAGTIRICRHQDLELAGMSHRVDLRVSLDRIFSLSSAGALHRRDRARVAALIQQGRALQGFAASDSESRPQILLENSCCHPRKCRSRPRPCIHGRAFVER